MDRIPILSIRSKNRPGFPLCRFSYFFRPLSGKCLACEKVLKPIRDSGDWPVFAFNIRCADVGWSQDSLVMNGLQQKFGRNPNSIRDPAVVQSELSPRSRHAQIPDENDDSLGDCDRPRVSKRWPCCVADAQGRSTGWPYHVCRVQGWRTRGRGTDRSRDVFQNRAHTLLLLPWPDVSESQGRRFQVQLLLRGDRRRLLDFRPKARGWRCAVWWQHTHCD